MNRGRRGSCILLLLVCAFMGCAKRAPEEAKTPPKPKPTPEEIIIDNRDADFTIVSGEWGTADASNGNGCYGEDFRYLAADSDEVGRAREPERHDRHQALAAGEHAPVLARHLGEGLERLVDRLGRVIAERRGLHRSSPRIRRASQQARTSTADMSHIWEIAFFLD